MPKDISKDMIHRFGYPVYATDCVGRNALVVAGGGGAAKTGVPNRIDVVNIQRDSKNRVSIAEVAGGLDTDTEAVMSLAVSNLSGSSSFFTSLEGHTCVEYFATLKASPSDDSSCSAPSPEHDHAELSATDLQTNAVHTDPIIRKRKGSTRVSDTDENVSSANHIPPVNSVEANANELVQWNVEKLRQFTIPALNPSSIVPRSPSSPPTRTHSSSLSGIPTCVTSGGPAGCWFAVGSDSGSVFLFDRIQFSETVTTNSGDSMKPFLVYPDVSVGLSTGVCALALTTTNSLSSGTFAADSSSPGASVYDTPLLATICEQPSWNLVHLWSVDNLQPASHNPAPHTAASTEPSSPKRRQRKDRAHRRKPVPSPIKNTHFFTALPTDSEVVGTTQPYAVASYSHFSTGTTPPSSQKPAARTENTAPERSTYRFKHCQFMKTHLDFLSTYEFKKGSAPGVNQPSCLLVTTMQPLCANRKSVSRVIVWQVPIPARSSQSTGPKSDVAAPPISLQPLTEAKLPQGDLPACLAVHPNRSRAIIGVGTMEGRVEVYFLSPRTHALTCVYSLKNAHPIFVTALTFLPVQGSNSSVSAEPSATKADRLPTAQSEQSYELVSVSVDRMLRWHPGPSCAQINRLAHGDNADQVGIWAQGRRCLQTMLTYLTLVFFIPILLALLDRMYHKEL